MAELVGRSPGQREEAHWLRLLPNFSELHQPYMTHSSAAARSRLDRFYSHFEATDLLDKHIYVGVEDWNFAEPTYRPVLMGRRSPHKSRETTRPITHNVVSRPDWASRFSNRYHEMLEEERSENAIQKLSLLKRAIRLTSDTMAN